MIGTRTAAKTDQRDVTLKFFKTSHHYYPWRTVSKKYILLFQQDISNDLIASYDAHKNNLEKIIKGMYHNSEINP